MIVSTHSRAEAAAYCKPIRCSYKTLFQHTAARRRLHTLMKLLVTRNGVSTHSRAEAAAFNKDGLDEYIKVSTHSRAEAAAIPPLPLLQAVVPFQHTAARRRLPIIIFYGSLKFNVSTHSRAEAAALLPNDLQSLYLFQHTAARRRLHSS